VTPALRLAFGLCALLIIASDRPKPKVYLERAAKNRKDHDIPEQVIRSPLRNVAQPDCYSCGAAALWSVCAYFGVVGSPEGMDFAEQFKAFKKELGTNPDDGTSYRKMAEYANKHGLHAESRDKLTCKQLEQLLQKGTLVICSIQAYGDPERYDKDESGHYVVAIGFNDKHFYFMDSSVPSDQHRRGYLPKEEFDRRWHDDEGTKEHPEPHTHLGIIIYSRKGYKGKGLTAFSPLAMRID